MIYYYHKNKTREVIGYDNAYWAFFLMINDKVSSLADWKKKFQEPNSFICGEDGNVISSEDIEIIITMRFGNLLVTSRNINWHGSNAFTGNHNITHITPGSLICGVRCLANEDCWDLCVPE